MNCDRMVVARVLYLTVWWWLECFTLSYGGGWSALPYRMVVARVLYLIVWWWLECFTLSYGSGWSALPYRMVVARVLYLIVWWWLECFTLPVGSLSLADVLLFDAVRYVHKICFVLSYKDSGLYTSNNSSSHQNDTVEFNHTQC